MKDAILEVTRPYENVIFLSGHDHNLQYIREEGHHFLISGAGSKLNAITKSKSLVYGHMVPGYMQLDVYPDQGTHLKIHEIDVRGKKSSVVLSRWLRPETD